MVHLHPSKAERDDLACDLVEPANLAYANEPTVEQGELRKVDDDVNDLVSVLREAAFVLLVVERLGIAVVALPCLDEHEAVNMIVQFFEAQLEQLKFVEEHEAVVDPVGSHEDASPYHAAAVGAAVGGRIASVIETGNIMVAIFESKNTSVRKKEKKGSVERVGGTASGNVSATSYSHQQGSCPLRGMSTSSSRHRGRCSCPPIRRRRTFQQNRKKRNVFNRILRLPSYDPSRRPPSHQR